MSGFDAVFNIWMTLAEVLMFLKIKKVISRDWGIVVAPLVAALLLKAYIIFVERA